MKQQEKPKSILTPKSYAAVKPNSFINTLVKASTGLFNVGNEVLSSAEKGVNVASQYMAKELAKRTHNLTDDDLPSVEYEDHASTMQRHNPTKEIGLGKQLAYNALGDPLTFLSGYKVGSSAFNLKKVATPKYFQSSSINLTHPKDIKKAKQSLSKIGKLEGASGFLGLGVDALDNGVINKHQKGGSVSLQDYFTKATKGAVKAATTPFKIMSDVSAKGVEDLSTAGKSANYVAQATARKIAKSTHNLSNNDLPFAQYENHSDTFNRLVSPRKDLNFVQSTAIDLIGDPSTFIGGSKLIKPKVKLKTTTTTPTPIVKNNNFKSEINWENWNKEIPGNKELMREYNSIEKMSKENGTWMKNPDGTKFQGTPEQFIQTNSKNFKASFPEGYNKVYRGVTQYEPNFSKGTQYKGDRAIFTGNKDLAKGYTTSYSRDVLLDANTNSSGVWELAQRKGGNSPLIDARGSDWTDINIDRGLYDKKELLGELKKTGNHYNKLKSNNAPKELLEAQKGRLVEMQSTLKTPPTKQVQKSSKDFITNFKKYNPNYETVTTDEIADYISKTPKGKDINNLTIKRVIDGDYGTVSIHNNKSGNYLKSLRGNNGMFDLTNPDVLKTFLPIGTGASIGLKQNKKGE